LNEIIPCQQNLRRRQIINLKQIHINGH